MLDRLDDDELKLLGAYLAVLRLSHGKLVRECINGWDAADAISDQGRAICNALTLGVAIRTISFAFSLLPRTR